jgi:hypothetical protein
MKKLADFLPAPGWATFADPLPAGQAALSLLRNHSPADGEPTLAVFAAEQTGDEHFVAAVRRRAARIELEEAEQALEGEGSPKLGLIELREALTLEPSAAAKSLLPRAEAKLRQAEHSAAELGY